MNRWLGLPEIASEHGARLDHVNSMVHWLMLVLFVVWGAFFIYLLVRFRQKKNPQADYVGTRSKMSTYGEIAVAAVEVVLLVGFSIPLYSQRVNDLPDESEATLVRVIGEQFAWNVHYPGPDRVFGRTDVNLVDTESNPVGLDRDDPNGKDDVTTVNQLYLPVDKPVLIRLSSKDVIHSFGIPEMRIKQDAIPGLQVPVWFEPIVTTAEMQARKGEDDFNYEIGCYQLCGNGHARMRGFTRILPQDEYDAWMEEQQSLLSEEGADDFWG